MDAVPNPEPKWKLVSTAKGLVRYTKPRGQYSELSPAQKFAIPVLDEVRFQRNPATVAKARVFYINKKKSQSTYPKA